MRSIYLQIAVVLLMSIGKNIYANSPETQTQGMDGGLPNLSDRPKTQNKTIDIFASALYWYTSETVYWGFTLKTGQNVEQNHFQAISFDWDPGFRVGFGYNMHHDQWDTQFAYTRFQTDTSDHASGSVTSAFLAARLVGIEPFDTGKVSLNLNYNMFDWDLGRSFFVSKFLSLRPFIGAKAGWINQKIRLKYTTPNFVLPGITYTAEENVKNNFRGGGPQGGLDGKWILGNIDRHIFSLLGNFSGAFMWGNWTVADKFVDVLGTQTSVPMGGRNFGAIMFQALLGFGWDFNFDKNRSHFSLNVGYEIQDWLNQFQVFTNFAGTANSDLILQGLTVDLRCDF